MFILLLAPFFQSFDNRIRFFPAKPYYSPAQMSYPDFLLHSIQSAYLFITSPKLKANQIKLKTNINFKADAKLKRSVSVVHLERSKLKPHSASCSNEEIDKLLANYFSNNPVLTHSDFQRLCGFTPTTAARHIKRLKEEKKLKNINTYYNPIYMTMPGYYGKAEIKEDKANTIQQ